MIVAPLVHMNGTSGEDLQRQQELLYAALNNAVDAALAATPNARDYYPLGDGAWTQAREEHSNRVATLVSMREAALLAYEAIQEQMDRKVQS